ncbi:hypothetical protein LSTR_LSTR006309 [Laodelphax striatellus]|uniref:Uncharacterized protein n=1 Tax=Laodelphax striatellus TaxID=195883 RepID=A0A482X5V7_LAOST|nr:hypothetical protein LSTR_LSTR006309 [Laodelphax striatellus]
MLTSFRSRILHIQALIQRSQDTARETNIGRMEDQSNLSSRKATISFNARCRNLNLEQPERQEGREDVGFVLENATGKPNLNAKNATSPIVWVAEQVYALTVRKTKKTLEILFVEDSIVNVKNA